ncbi:MAG TPA: TraR/DksA C4-type zinc finger protein [Candidatus Acidoferrales bacterium]|jgi:DnaK suppressor protein|nr:TraR/DksA C4-type zinc finger protein [Candidatus Acidoferrales bacterium]
MRTQFEVIKNMPTITRTPRNKFSALEKELASQRSVLRQRIDRHRMDVVMDRELDDETAAAVDSVSRDMLAATLERERRTLREIESALVRMEKGDYGTCDSCGDDIPKARLEALPWARRCIRCAERAIHPSGLRVAS